MKRWTYMQWAFFVILLFAPFIIYDEYQQTEHINPVSVIMCAALALSLAIPDTK